MRNTKQRSVILDIINNSYNHLDAYAVYNLARKQISNISLGTVYRNLKILEDAHLINVLYYDTDKIRYDRVSNHHHFICQRCQKIIDIHDLNIKIPKTIANNTVTDYKIIIEGICEKCQKED